MALPMSAWGDAHAPAMHAVASHGAGFESRVEEYPADASGIRTQVEYRVNPTTGKREKVIRRIRRDVRTYAIPEAVLERQKWSCFGDALSGEGCTTLSYEALHIEKSGAEERPDAASSKLEGKTTLVQCRKCGSTQHYTLKCPLRDLVRDADTAHSGVVAGGDTPTGDRYVPPGRRGGDKAGESTETPQEEMRRLRIDNLSDEVDEDELRALLQRFGKLEKVMIKAGKGGSPYALATYMSHSEAAKAKDSLNGYGLKFLILKVEFAKSAPTNFAGSSGLSGQFVSGYGKALPQNRG